MMRGLACLLCGGAATGTAGLPQYAEDAHSLVQRFQSGGQALHDLTPATSSSVEAGINSLVDKMVRSPLFRQNRTRAVITLGKMLRMAHGAVPRKLDRQNAAELGGFTDIDDEADHSLFSKLFYCTKDVGLPAYDFIVDSIDALWGAHNCPANSHPQRCYAVQILTFLGGFFDGSSDFLEFEEACPVNGSPDCNTVGMQFTLRKRNDLTLGLSLLGIASGLAAAIMELPVHCADKVGGTANIANYPPALFPIFSAVGLASDGFDLYTTWRARDTPIDAPNATVSDAFGVLGGTEDLTGSVLAVIAHYMNTKTTNSGWKLNCAADALAIGGSVANAISAFYDWRSCNALEPTGDQKQARFSSAE